MISDNMLKLAQLNQNFCEEKKKLHYVYTGEIKVLNN